MTKTPLPPTVFKPKTVDRKAADQARYDGFKQTATFVESYHKLYTEAAAEWLRTVQ